MGGGSSKQTLKQYIENDTDIKSIIKTAITNEANTDVSSINLNIIEEDIYKSGICCPVYDKDGNIARDKDGNPVIIPNCVPPRDPDGNVMPICGGEFEIDQRIKGKQKIINKVNQKITEKMINDLTAKIQDQAKAALKDISGDVLSKLPGFGGKSKQNIQQTIKNSISETMEVDTVMKNISNVTDNQLNENNLKLVICGPLTKEECNVDQNIMSNILITNIASQIGNLLQSNKVLNSTYNGLTGTEIKKDTSPFLDFLKKLFGGGNGLPKWLIYVVIAIILVIVLVVIFYLFKAFKKPASQPARQPVGQPVRQPVRQPAGQPARQYYTQPRSQQSRPYPGPTVS